ncbi:hypothetical protein [Phaffia rhodozyma]|uniref:Actin cortical patch SUR7/pH-response regulator PalI n=1 Tax=Phaffia rhodozyma TaxID=264483 RepID=A0A0F7SQJ3_PHARH|nr:hypothetical protein [Phaffia rhodozyma]
MRKAPYVLALPVLVVTIVAGFAALFRPDWIVSTTSPAGSPLLVRTEYGLWRKCTKATIKRNQPNTFSPHMWEGASWTLDALDVPPPSNETYIVGEWKCASIENSFIVDISNASSEMNSKGTGKFCVLWSTAGYLTILSLLPLLASCVALLVIAVGAGERQVRKSRRKKGWKGVAGCCLFSAILQIIAFAMAAHVFRTDSPRFLIHARLYTSFWLIVGASTLSLALFGALTFTGLAARAGKRWAGGRSAGKKRGRHGRNPSTGSARQAGATADENAPLLNA